MRLSKSKICTDEWVRSGVADASLLCLAHMESHLAREVVHSAGVHQTQRVAHRLRAQDALTRDWTDPPVGKGGSHDTARLAVDLYGTELKPEESRCVTALQQPAAG